jgi:hypothetical protein
MRLNQEIIANRNNRPMYNEGCHWKFYIPVVSEHALAEGRRLTEGDPVGLKHVGGRNIYSEYNSTHCAFSWWFIAFIWTNARTWSMLKTTESEQIYNQDSMCNAQPEQILLLTFKISPQGLPSICVQIAIRIHLPISIHLVRKNVDHCIAQVRYISNYYH